MDSCELTREDIDGTVFNIEKKIQNINNSKDYFEVEREIQGLENKLESY